MSWPQITAIVMLAMSLGIVLARHGKPRGTHSFWVSLIDAGIWIFILIAGGFFK